MAEIKTEKNGLATYKYVYKNPRPSEKVDVEMFQDQVKRKYSDGGVASGTPKKGYKGKDTAERIAWQEQQPALRIGGGKGPPVTGRPHKVAGFGNINPNEPTNVRKKRPGGRSKGGKV